MKTDLVTRMLASLPGLGWLSKEAHDQDTGSSMPYELTVLKDGGNKSSPLLHGLMFEVSPSLKRYIDADDQEMDHSGSSQCRNRSKVSLILIL